jgi:[ribosomal protein S18]-alanine N-acetyltransferase
MRRSKGGRVTIQVSRGAKLGLAVENSEQSWFRIVSLTTGQLAAILSCLSNPGNPIRATPATIVPRYNDDVPFTVRDFQPADFETLWRLDQECFPPGISYSPAELKLYMRRRGSFTLVAEDAAATAGKGLVAGFIVAEADGRGHGHIITIDVIASVRRFGVGSLLLRTAEDRLCVAGCRSIELETAVDNSSALAFYKRHGYSVIKTFPRYYSNGVDALVLQKDLP